MKRTDWTRTEAARSVDLPLLDRPYPAQAAHRTHHPTSQVQLSTLLSLEAAE